MVTIRATNSNYCGCRRHMNQDYLKGDLADWLTREELPGSATWRYDHASGLLVFVFDSVATATAFKLTFA